MSNILKILATFVASLIERSFGSKPNTLLTITGVIGALSAFLTQLPPTIVPIKYQPWLIAAAAFFSILAGALGVGKAQAKKAEEASPEEKK